MVTIRQVLNRHLLLRSLENSQRRFWALSFLINPTFILNPPLGKRAIQSVEMTACARKKGVNDVESRALTTSIVQAFYMLLLYTNKN